MKQVALKVLVCFLAVASGLANANCVTDTAQADFQAGTASNVDLTSSFGNVILASSTSGSGSGNVDQQNLTNSGYGDIFNNSQWIAQTFKAGSSGSLTRVDVDLGCAFCSGTPPSMIVSIRATSGGLPSGGDLASATIPTINSGGVAAFYTATFATPATVSSGTTYAIILRAATAFTSGKTIMIDSALNGSQGNDSYAGGALFISTSSGSSWNARVLSDGKGIDGVFKTYVGGGGSSGYVAAGDLISSVKDSAPPSGSTPTWTTLSWTSTVPTNTALKFQAAASNVSTGPFNFVGPDGTSATFFTASSADLSRFNGNRYLKYRAFLSTGTSTSTPVLSEATACYSSVSTTPQVDLAVTINDGAASQTAGLNATYNILVSNSGPSDAPNSIVTDNFPSNVTCTWTCSGTSGGSCPASGSGNIAATVNLPKSSSVNLIATCSIASSASGTLSDTVSVSPANGVIDTNTGNNAATDSDSIVVKPDVKLTMTDNQDMVQIGDPVDYIMEVKNLGPSDAAVNLTDNLPAQLSTKASWVCTGAGGASCVKGQGSAMNTNATIPAGGTATYVYSSTVASDDAGNSFTNVAVAHVNNGTDPNGANNSASDTDIVVVFNSGFEGSVAAAMQTTAASGGASMTAQFGVDAGLLNQLDTIPVTVVSGQSGSGAKLFDLQLMRLGSDVLMRSYVPIDGTIYGDVSPWETVDLGQGQLYVQWQSATSAGDDGFLRAGSLNNPVLLSANNEQQALAQTKVRVENDIPWLVFEGQ